MSAHHCHAVGCSVRTRPTLLMCAAHWSLVPRDLQTRLLAAYRPGQCADKRPSRAWLRASAECRRAVASTEGRAAAVDYLDGVIAALGAEVSDG